MTVKINGHIYDLVFWGQPSTNELMLIIRAAMLPIISDISASSTIVITNDDSENTFEGFNEIASIGSLGGTLNVLLRRTA